MHYPLLAACCRLQWDITVEELTEERLRFELDKIISSGKSHSLADILPLLTVSLRMVLEEPDVNARVLKYFMDCDEIVSKNDLTSTFSSEIGQQMKCTILTRHLEPSQLREKVEWHQEFVDRTSETDERSLFQLVLEKAHEWEKEFQLSREHEGRGRFQGNQGSSSDKTRRQRPSKQQRERNKLRVTEGKAAVIRPSRALTCFHCGGKHHVRSCTMVDEATKKRLMNEHRKIQAKSELRRSDNRGGKKRLPNPKMDERRSSAYCE